MKRISKIITVVLSLALIVGAVMVLSAANTAAPTLEAANVAYGDQLTLVFTVTNIADGETAGIVVYETEDAEKYVYSNFTAKEDGGVVYYETFGIAAKDIGKTYYVAAASKDADGNLKIGEKTPYSILTYLDARLADDEITLAQENLYNMIKAYGAAAADVFKAK